MALKSQPSRGRKYPTKKGDETLQTADFSTKKSRGSEGDGKEKDFMVRCSK